MKTVLAISGSLRRESTNRAVLDAFEKATAGQLRVGFYEGLGALPHFNPDLDKKPLPTEVIALRAQVAKADALFLSSPEYAHGIPGSLKNMLDWLVSDPQFPGKPIAMINASITNAEFVNGQLTEILKTMSSRVVFCEAMSPVAIRKRLNSGGILADPALGGILRGAISALTTAIS